MSSICTPNTGGHDRRWFHTGARGGCYFPRHLNLLSKVGLALPLPLSDPRMTEWRSSLAPLIWMSSARALQVRLG